MFFLIDVDDGAIKKAAETLKELKKDIDPDLFYECDDIWIMKTETVDGNFTIPVKDLVGNRMIYDLFEAVDDEEEQ